MATYDGRECDRCGAAIFESMHRRPDVINISVEHTGESDYAVYEEHQRELCRSCGGEELLAWIDNPDVDRGNQADLPYVDNVASTLESLGEELTEIADELEEYNDANGD